jgi:hypothetical protein
MGPVSVCRIHCSLKFIFRLNANLFHNFYCPGHFLFNIFGEPFSQKDTPDFYFLYLYKTAGYQDMIIKTINGVLLNFLANNALVMLQKSADILLNV